MCALKCTTTDWMCKFLHNKRPVRCSLQPIACNDFARPTLILAAFLCGFRNKW